MLHPSQVHTKNQQQTLLKSLNGNLCRRAHDFLAEEAISGSRSRGYMLHPSQVHAAVSKKRYTQPLLGLLSTQSPVPIRAGCGVHYIERQVQVLH